MTPPPTPLVPATRGTRSTVAPVDTVDITGSPSDVMWTVGRYREMGALVRPPEMRPATTPGVETARVRLLVGTPVLPVGPDTDRIHYDTIDYLIAAAPLVKYGLITAAAGIVGYGIYRMVTAVGAWLNIHGAAIVDTTLGIVGLAGLLLLLGLLRGGKGCPGITSHCGGCRG